MDNQQKEGWVGNLVDTCLRHRLPVLLLATLATGWGLWVAPFDWDFFGLPRDPVPVDAIPDTGENQQIVFTEWVGRSPQDVDNQITYPLTTALLGLPGVRTVRSQSFFGFSSIYVIFDEDIEFYWSRSRILERLNSLPPGTLPAEVRPVLGPDATALGQIFWYTLEGRDATGTPTGGWDLQELRTIQDWTVRYGLLAAKGVAEVASVGGFVKEYQVDVDPDSLRDYGLSLAQVLEAVRMTNLDVGARNIEINNVEYFIRGLGFIESNADIADAVIAVHEQIPITVGDVARVSMGPAQRRGALDKGGMETVGGVVVVRHGENPLAVIDNVKAKINEMAAGLPSKVLPDGTRSQVTIVPFYDRSKLIGETLNTLGEALHHEILVTILVILMLVAHIRGSILIAGLLPLAVLWTFIAMKTAGIDANIVALSGIAIAIGTMVDMSIVIVENILKRIESEGHANPKIIASATKEVGPAVVTAVATTVIGFLPVFAMEMAEGKLFKPLAFTKTFALIAAILISLTLLPVLAHFMLIRRPTAGRVRILLPTIACAVGIALITQDWPVLGLLLIIGGAYKLWVPHLTEQSKAMAHRVVTILLALIVLILLTSQWLPIGPGRGFVLNLFFVTLLIGGILAFFKGFLWFYPSMLRQCLKYRGRFLLLPTGLTFAGGMVWLGFPTFFGWLPDRVEQSPAIAAIADTFPGLGKEFMPPLDEGSYLYMPTTSVHASIDEVMDVMRKQDMAFAAIPEVSQAVGKLGRAETALDPAPISMIETLIHYHEPFLTDTTGKRLTFRHTTSENDLARREDGTPLLAPDGQPYKVRGMFLRDKADALIPDPKGRPFPLWRPPLEPTLNPGRSAWPGIRSRNDIWQAIVRAAAMPGTTSAPVLQPIAARRVMLQTGMRAPLGLKLLGPDLTRVERAGLLIEQEIENVVGINRSMVLADRIAGKPYLEIHIDRQAIARYGIKLRQVQETIEVAIGGKTIMNSVEGRERYPIRIRYPRELRDSPETIGRVLMATPQGAQIPLDQIARIKYVKGPQVIKSEDTFPVSYVIFDKLPGYADGEVMENVKRHLETAIGDGSMRLPDGVRIRYSGTYENQIRANKKLALVIPLALFLIFIILYMQFRRTSTAFMVFSGIVVACSGGFLLIWCYNQPWFLDIQLLGIHFRDLFQIHTINLSVAIWVGFLALFGIASDDGVIIATYLDQSFAKQQPNHVEAIREAVITAGMRRVRPALLTVATTVIALIPILTSSGRGSDIMIPMAIPTFGGMMISVISIFVVPVLYCAREEAALRHASKERKAP